MKVEPFTSLTRKSSNPFEKLNISDLGILFSSATNSLQDHLISIPAKRYAFDLQKF